jgi:hypothetical protein
MAPRHEHQAAPGVNGKQVFSVHSGPHPRRVRKPAEFLHEKHVGLADCPENPPTKVFRQAYAAIWSVSLVLATMPRPPVRPSPPDPSKIASGKPGAVHIFDH